MGCHEIEPLSESDYYDLLCLRVAGKCNKSERRKERIETRPNSTKTLSGGPPKRPCRRERPRAQEEEEEFGRMPERWRLQRSKRRQRR